MSPNLSIRLLEEGKVAEADKKKDEVEQKQRERRKEMAKQGKQHIPRFFRWDVRFLMYQTPTLSFFFIPPPPKKPFLVDGF